MLSLVAENYRDFGLRGFHRRLLSALDVYRELGFYVNEMEQAPPDREARIALSYSILRPDELDEYCTLRPGWAKQLAESRLRAGGRCFVARHAGEIAGFGWAMENGDTSEFLSREIPLHPDEIYIADTFTKPCYRGKGVSSAVISYCCQWYFKEGKRRALAAILPYNIASIRSFEKAGFRLAWRSGYAGIGGWRRPFDRPVK